MIDISHEIKRLIQYGINKGLINEYDKIYTRNRLLEVLTVSDYRENDTEDEYLDSPSLIFENIIEWALMNGRIKNDTVLNRDLFDTKIMGCLTPKPSEIINCFYTLYSNNKKSATDYFYSLSKSTNYIRLDRIKKDMKWKVETEFGKLDITINMSKPEKDPKDIEAQRNMGKGKYPKCLLCKENEGYEGRMNHPARQNHRVIPIELNNEKWFMQYSPYVYYNEHCIVFKDNHQEMKLTEETFIRIMEFVEKFPHYFIGSNADLPIVGGSILSHDHFQGGRYDFPMAKAETLEKFILKDFKGIILKRLKWPMPVLRIEGSNRVDVAKAAAHIYKIWQGYSDETVDVLSHTGDITHNTVTPIGRVRDGKFEMDIVLRNNRTSKEYPEGIFHPHRELHHIKKENIGLIEVMGLAVLPSRLNSELRDLSHFLINRNQIEKLEFKEPLLKHKDWCLEIMDKYNEICADNVNEIIRHEIGLKFLNVLKDAGVFKLDRKGEHAFKKFIYSL